MSNAELQIRPASAADAVALSRLTSELGYDADCAESYEHTLKLVLDAANHGIFVADLGGAVVGYALAHVHYRLGLAGPMVTLDELVVSHDARGKGVGTALTAMVGEFAADMGARRVELTTARTNDSYRRGFYGRAGFREVNAAVLRAHDVKSD